MRSGKKLSALAIPIVAISLSLAANSAARTLSVRGNHQPTPLSQVKFLQRRLAAAPGPGQARLHARFAERENNGPVKRLAIDPALKFISTFGAAATIYAIAVDQAGNSYIGGTTEAQGFTTTPGAFQETSPTGGGGSFVAMIDPSGALVYSTYLTGSSGADFIYGMAVDSAGDAYVTGWAVSSDFPIVNAFQPTLAGDADAFVAELNPTGSALIYSSYLGGANVVKFSDIGQVGTGIAVDATGSAYVIGHTNASDFPTTPGAFQPAFGGGTCGTPTQPAPCSDAFITKVAPGGSSLVYSTFLGGSNYDLGYGIAVDSTGNAYVAGATASFDFPTLNAFQAACVPIPGSSICTNAFTAELDPNGSALVFSTYLGGSCADYAQAVALDSDGDVTATGYTCSKDFPSVNAFQPSNASTSTPPHNAFVTEFAAGGGSLIYSTYLGGSGLDDGRSIAVDGFGEAFVTGITTSTDFPMANALQATSQGALQDAFVTGFQAAGQGLIYSTYLGGPAGSNTQAWGIAVDSQGDAWVGGSTDATTFPAARSEVVRRYVSPTPQTTSSSPAAFAGAITLDAARVSSNQASLAFGAQLAGGTTASQPVTISNPGTAALSFSAIGASSNFSVASGGTCSTSSSVAPNGNCTVNVAFAPTAGGNLTGTLTLTDNGIGSPQTVSLSGTGQDFAISANGNSASVAPGGAATYALTVTPQGGLDQSVSFACAGAPAGAFCTVSPAVLKLDGSTAASAAAKVTTAAGSLAPRGPDSLPPAGRPPAPLVLALASAVLAVLVLMRMGAFGIWRTRWALGAIVLLAALSTSCGGGGNPGTPAGSYILTITATTTSGSTTATHTVTLNLKVT